MDPSDTPAQYLLPGTLSVAALAGALVASLLVWRLLHWMKRLGHNRPIVRLLFFPIRVAVGTGTLLILFQIIARYIYLAASWPLPLIAAIGAFTIECIIALYAPERRIISDSEEMPGASKLVLALRIGAVLLVVGILLQPIYTRELERRFQREVVVLLDDSQSMQFTDEAPTISEQLSIASLFGIRAADRTFTLTEAQRRLRLMQDRLRIESAALRTPEGVSEAAANALVAKRIDPLKSFVKEAALETDTLQRIIATQRNQFSNLNATTKNLLSDYDKRLRNNLASVFIQTSAALEKGEFRTASTHVDNVNRQIRYILERLPEAIADLDQAYFGSLSPRDQKLITDTAKKARTAIADEILKSGEEEGESIIQLLKEKYKLRFMRFASQAHAWEGHEFIEEENDGEDADEPPAKRAEKKKELDRTRTDFTRALESIMEKVATGDLAGVVVLSDGRHNGERGIEDAVRRMALQDAPVCSVVIGSTVGPKDASVVDVRVPESIYLDDRAIIQADLKLDGLPGETLNVQLFQGDDPLDNKEVTVPDGDKAYRTTVRFSHTPREKGIFKYRVAVSTQPDEYLPDNNDWNFEVAVTDDRTNVLLIDGYPRWEFRYLRNLFYARDKSVHLQYVLMHPDQIEGAPPPTPVPASASRPFGNAEATHLPNSRAEWLKFDAIIIGDVAPTTFTDDDWFAIAECIRDRAGLLVCIAGPRFMPHAYDREIFREMLPILYEQSPRSRFNSPEAAYRLQLTPEGRNSLIMQQSMTAEINEMVWNSLPPLMWRSPVLGVKEGAEVLAWASPITPLDGSVPAPVAPENSFDAFNAQKTLHAKNALVVAQRYALGKTLMLNFDRTWRLRYGIGDLYHHKFWGQILRWAAGENLRAGNEFIRLGTDKLTYVPGEPVKVIAKILNEYYTPVANDTVTVSVFQRDRIVVRKQLRYRPDSNGIYEAPLDNLPYTGRYRIELESREAQRVLQRTDLSKVETEFMIENPRNQIELNDLTSNPPFLESLAALSGGAVADPDDANALLEFLGDPGKIIRERRETTLWDNMVLLLLAFGLVTAEWLLRRKAGLS